MKPLRVLVVDDSAYNRRTVSDMLTEIQGVTVVGKAADGDEALRMAADLDPDLVTLDLEMPRMDGFTFLRLLMARRPTPVIVVSGYSAKENVFRALELGAIDFVAKPSRTVSSDLATIRDELAEKVGLIRHLSPSARQVGRRKISSTRLEVPSANRSVQESASQRPPSLSTPRRSSPPMSAIPDAPASRPSRLPPSTRASSPPGADNIRPPATRSTPPSSRDVLSVPPSASSPPPRLSSRPSAVPGTVEIKYAEVPMPAAVPSSSNVLVPAPGVVPGYVVVIGSSTGGPTALVEVFSELTAEVDAAVIVAQHMPERFTRTFAERLDRLGGMKIREAHATHPLRAGEAWISPGGKCVEILETGGEVCAQVVEPGTGDRYLPSADRLIASAGRVLRERSIAVVLTGMGDDGARGVVEVRRQGGRVLAEAPESAVIYGMPGAAARTGCVDESLPLGTLAKRLAELVKRDR